MKNRKVFIKYQSELMARAHDEKGVMCVSLSDCEKVLKDAIQEMSKDDDFDKFDFWGQKIN